MSKILEKIKIKHEELNIVFNQTIECLAKFWEETKLTVTSFENEIKLDNQAIKSEIEDKDKKISELTVKVNESDAKRTEKEREVSTMEGINNLLQNRVNELSEKIIEMRNELNREINESNNRIKLKERMLFEHKEKIMELEKFNKEVKANYSKLTGKNIALESKEKEFATNYNQALDKIGSCEKVINQYKKNLENVNVEKQVIEKNLMIKEDKYRKAILKLASAEEELLRKDTLLIQNEAKIKRISQNAELMRNEISKIGILRGNEFDLHKRMKFKNNESDTLVEMMKNMKPLRKPIIASNLNYKNSQEKMIENQLEKRKKSKKKLEPIDKIDKLNSSYSHKQPSKFTNPSYSKKGDLDFDQINLMKSNKPNIDKSNLKSKHFDLSDSYHRFIEEESNNSNPLLKDPMQYEAQNDYEVEADKGQNSQVYRGQTLQPEDEMNSENENDD